MAQLDKLKKDGGDQAEKIKKFEADAQAAATQIKQMTDQAARMKTSLDAVNAQLAKALQTGSDLEGQVKLLSAGKKTLEASLAKVNKDLDVCCSDNAGLCGIAHQILNTEQSGNALHRIIQNEPLTQVGKVRLEKFTQKYRDKIDQKKVRNQ